MAGRILKGCFHLYVKVTGALGMFFAVLWTLGTIGNNSNSLIDVFLYTGWLVSSLLPFPFYSHAVLLLILSTLLLYWHVTAYKQAHRNYILLQKSQNINANKDKFVFALKFARKYIYELFLYAMSLFVTVHLIFIVVLFVHALLSKA